MSLVISSVFTYDTDAGNYIQAVETVDGQALESATRKAINDFVIGCKQDGIWDAIKASCILAGAKTLNGALVPLAGTAPTNYNFVAGDYNRKTGLVGDGSTKYLDSNRANNVDPQDSKHLSVYLTNYVSAIAPFISSSTYNLAGMSSIGRYSANPTRVNFAVNGDISFLAIADFANGFAGANRASSTESTFRYVSTLGPKQGVFTVSSASNSDPIYVFSNSAGTSGSRIAFYSIGESLDLAKLDGRVTDLINKFQEVIP